jgi:hypothetical protein
MILLSLPGTVHAPLMHRTSTAPLDFAYTPLPAPVGLDVGGSPVGGVLGLPLVPEVPIP